MVSLRTAGTGKAVVAKMPLILQNTMAAMQTRMTTLTPQIMKIQQEMIEKLRATEQQP